jgi:chaperone required for assembly of F1-ATPase
MTRDGDATGSEGATNVPGRDPPLRPLPRRFYAMASAVPQGDGHALMLDGRSARTPGKRLLALPTAAFGDAVAAEWAAQGSNIDPASMPLTRIANTVIDGVAHQADAVAAEVVKYAGSDLLCYRADFPAELVARQAAAWDPVLDWAHRALGARFYLAEGVMPVEQLPETLERVAGRLAGLDPFRLAAVHVKTTLTGSALLALAVLDRHLTPHEAWVAAHVDEDFQISQWGEDAEAMERRARRRAELDAAARVLELVASGGP